MQLNGMVQAWLCRTYHQQVLQECQDPVWMSLLDSGVEVLWG